jgi:hypothetical protein
MAYGDIYARGVRGVVLETFGVGNMPDLPIHGWLPWLRSQRRKGLQVYLASQCGAGSLHPELYRSGSLALELGVQAGPQSACLFASRVCAARLHGACAHAALPTRQHALTPLARAARAAVTPECAVVKMMLCLAHPDLPLGQPIAGEL